MEVEYVKTTSWAVEYQLTKPHTDRVYKIIFVGKDYADNYAAIIRKRNVDHINFIKVYEVC